MMRRALATTLLVLATTLGAPAAGAADLDRLRAEGVIAERYDGYVELRKEGNPEAKAVVEKVNAKRRRLYKKRAQNQGVPVEQVGRVYAKQLLEQLPDGTYFLRPEGGYVRK